MSEHSPAVASLAESVSALADGEASELELARLLKASDNTPEIKSVWDRYHLARSAMAQDLQSTATPGFAERVSAAIAEEQSPRSARFHWWANAGRLAVAASVAGAVLIGAQLYQNDSLTAPGTTSVMADAPTPSTTDIHVAADHSLPAGFNAPPLAARPVSTQPFFEATPRRVIFEPREAGVKVSEEQIRHYLNQLAESHTEHATVNNAQGLLPFARLPLVEDD